MYALAIIATLSSLYITCSDTCSYSSDVCVPEECSSTRFILYDVNQHEGFNLRRDIYMRLAILMKHLNTVQQKYYLVLPPWDNLAHWRSELAGGQNNLPWGLFFNLKSLQDYAPVIEAYEFLENYPNILLDHVIVLQHYQDLWAENFTWVNKWSAEPCQRPLHYRQNDNNTYNIAYGSYRMLAKNVQCVSFQGPASLLKDLLNSFDKNHAETVLHDYFGDAEYWKCRKSMRFSDELFQLASDFKKSALPSSEAEKDFTPKASYYEGEPYLCVHFRRRDYKYSRAQHIPSIEHAAFQIKEKLSTFNLSIVFVATDTDEAEIQKLSYSIRPFKTVRFIPSLEILRSYKDGGVAIIEQIVCSYARFFIGSYESTFSFRIQEERELLNFDPDTTFNRLCGDEEKNCKQPTRWLKTE